MTESIVSVEAEVPRGKGDVPYPFAKEGREAANDCVLPFVIAIFAVRH